MFFPEDYVGFHGLPEDFNPYNIPEGKRPNTWMINLTGMFLLAW